MDEQNKEIILEIIKTRREIQTYMDIWVNRIQKKWYFMILFSIMLILASIFSIFNIINFNKIINNQYAEISFIIIGVFFIILSIWVLTKNRSKLTYSNLGQKTIKELNNELEIIKNLKKTWIENAVKSIAMVYTIILAIISIIIIKILRDDFISIPAIFDTSEKLNKSDFLPFINIFIFLFAFFVGEMISMPLIPGIFSKIEKKHKNIIKNTYIDFISLTKLNPEI